MLEKSRSILSFNSALDKEGEIIIQNGEKSSESEETKSGWIEHTWSTFVERDKEDCTDDQQNRKLLLSPFQNKKFTHFFYHVLNLYTGPVVSKENFERLNSRVRHYIGWSVNTPQYVTLHEVHGLFLEYFFKNTKQLTQIEEGFDFGQRFDSENDDELESKDNLTLDEWLDVWGSIVGEAKTLHDLPLWLQYYPKALFDIINRSGSGIIAKTELELFYKAFPDAGKHGDAALKDLTEKSYNRMTANGDEELNFENYKSWGYLLKI